MTDIRNIDGDVIYTSASPNDTIKKALEQAVAAGVSLAGADLRGANLRRANLRGANLRRANLEGADLRKTNLWDTDLEGAKIILGNKTFTLEACND